MVSESSCLEYSLVQGSLAHLLHHHTAEGSVRPAHDGEAQGAAGAGDLHVGDLSLQDGQPGDPCIVTQVTAICNTDDPERLQSRNAPLRPSLT